MSITIFCVLICSGCAVGLGKPELSANLRGTVRDATFVFKTGYVDSSDPDLYYVCLFSQNAVEQPNLATTEGTTYPFLLFTLQKSKGAQKYAVSTLGTPADGMDGQWLSGYMSAGEGTLFDDGVLNITEIDTVGMKISGNIVRATTIEGTSKLDGAFSVPIR
jgi:hypothetical protein